MSSQARHRPRPDELRAPRAARLEWGPGLTMDDTGVVRLSGPTGAGVSLRPPRVIIDEDGSDLVQWRFQSWDEAPDENQVEWTCGQLRAGVRHRVTDETWEIRAWVANDSPEAVALAQANLVVDPGQAAAWVWPSGALGLIALTAVGCDQLVGLRVRAGELMVPETLTAPDVEADGELTDGAEHNGILGGPVLTLVDRADDSVFRWLADGHVISPGQRAIFTMQGRPLASWAELAGLLPAWLPALAVPPHGVIEFDQPDGATTAPGAETEDIDGRTYIIGRGSVNVTVTSPRGSIRLASHFARDLDDDAARLAERWLNPYFPAAHVGAALTMSSNLPQFARGEMKEVGQVLVERGAERLEHLLRGTPTVLPTEVAFLIAGLDEWGYDVVAEMGDRLAPWLVGMAPPGLGLALIRVWRNRYIAQRDLERVRRLVMSVGREAVAPDWLARLEWNLVRGDGPRPRDLRRLMVFLGAGLPGQVVARVAGMAVTDVAVARAVAVTSLVDDHVHPPGEWPSTLCQAAELAGWRLLARAGDNPIPAAWLALSLL
ncbi:MAG: hypothetical protein LBH76_04635 [Propionibacteriaceae bacterium]|jgi:hypothetical protein|nr:hypothetical protein [Propionibacteriaceae bacterium]